MYHYLSLDIISATGSSNDGDVMRCTFYYIALILAAQYSLLLVVMLSYVQRLIRLHSWRVRGHRTEMSFLLLAICNTLGRIVYFLAWPHLGYDGIHCEPEGIGHRIAPSNAFIKALAIVPASFFIAAFSINVYTFGRVYHEVLLLQRSRIWIIIPVILIILNIAVTIEILMWTILSHWIIEEIMEDIGGTISISLVITSGILAILFVTYGALLYTGARFVTRTSSTASAGATTATASHTPLLHAAGHALSSQVHIEHIDVITGGSPRQSVKPIAVAWNPMRKLLIVSIVCMICFLWRAFSQLFTDMQLKGHASWVNILLFFEISEIIPMISMLYVFEGGRSSSSAAAIAGTIVNDGPVRAAAVAAARHRFLQHDRRLLYGAATAPPAPAPAAVATTPSVPATAIGASVIDVGDTDVILGKELTPMISRSEILNNGSAANYFADHDNDRNNDNDDDDDDLHRSYQQPITGNQTRVSEHVRANSVVA